MSRGWSLGLLLLILKCSLKSPVKVFIWLSILKLVTKIAFKFQRLLHASAESLILEIKMTLIPNIQIIKIVSIFDQCQLSQSKIISQSVIDLPSKETSPCLRMRHLCLISFQIDRDSPFDQSLVEISRRLHLFTPERVTRLTVDSN